MRKPDIKELKALRHDYKQAYDMGFHDLKEHYNELLAINIAAEEPNTTAVIDSLLDLNYSYMRFAVVDAQIKLLEGEK